MERKRVKQLEVMVAKTIVETPDTTTLVLFTGNDTLAYKPGHFCTIDPSQFDALARWQHYLEDTKGKKEKPRAYSLASSPHEKYLAVTVKEETYQTGQTKYPPLLSPFLVRRVPSGTRMVITGFTGPYHLPDDIESTTDHLVHICAGSGSVPNYSILKHALHHNLKLRHTFIYGNKTWEDTIYRQEIDALARAHPDQLKIVHCLSREKTEPSNDAPFIRSRVNLETIRAHVEDPSAAHFFVCGPAVSKFDKEAAKERGVEPAPRFMETVLDALLELGIEKHQLHRESYG